MPPAPLPPIIVNVPAPGGPAWWITGLIAVVSAVIGVLATNVATRGREHQKWLWERRVDLYTDFLETLDKIDEIADLYENNHEVFKQIGLGTIVNAGAGLEEKRLFIGPFVHDRLRASVNFVAAEYRTITAIMADDPSNLVRLWPHFRNIEKVNAEMRQEIDRVIERPPPLFALTKAQKQSFSVKRWKKEEQPPF